MQALRPVDGRALVRGRAWPLAVSIAALVYVVALSSEAIAAHRSFVTGFDTALYDQYLWLLANGHEPFSTIVSRPMLADHFQPGLALLVPFYWVGGGVPLLLILQSVALASTGPALYALGRAAGSRPALAAVPGLLWLACPFVARLNLGEFRPTAFASVLIVFSVLGALQGRPWLLGTTAVLALSLKEDVALVYLMMGLVLVIRRKRLMGAALAAGSTAWFVGAWLIMRSGSDAAEAFGRRFAGERGGSVAEALLWILQHPFEAGGDVVRESLPYLILLLVATGGLALLAPLWMLLALPVAAHNALSAYEPQHLLSFHYHHLTMTGLFIAAALGTRRLESGGRLLRLVSGAGIGVAAVLAVVAGKWAHAHWTEGIRLQREPTRAALSSIPDDVSVAASVHLLPHLSHRVEVYALPEPFIPLDTGSPLSDLQFSHRAAGVDYVAYRVGDLPVEYAGSPSAVLAMLERERFTERTRAGRVTIFERSPGASVSR